MAQQNKSNAGGAPDNRNIGGSQGNKNNRNKMPRFNLTWLYIIIAIALG